MQPLIEGLREFEPEIDPEQIADILWLAQYISIEDSSSQSVVDERASERNPQTEKASSVSSSIPVSSPRSPQTQPTTRTAATPSELSGMTGLLIRVAAARSLRKPIELERALRPLMRRMPSRLERRLDEVATAERIAETQMQLTVTQPALQRWFDLALVVEETSLTEIWRKTIKELQELLEHLGAFRDVRTWTMRRTKTGELELFPRHGEQTQTRRVYHPKELIDTSGQRLIWVLSDCTSVAWWSGKVHQWLQIWVQANLVTIIHLLPERLWGRGVLGEGLPVQLRTQIPGASNKRWQVEGLPIWKSVDVERALTLPVVTLEPAALKQWALAVAGHGEDATIGVLFERDWCKAESIRESFDSTSQSSPFQLVQQFRAAASPLARRLAILMAAVPVNLSVIELIQETMVPESRQVHLAEVYLSGLLEQRANGAFEFKDGVRQELRKSLAKSDALLLLERVSAYITVRLGREFRSFAALLTADLSELASGYEQVNAFAEIALDTLRQLGGRFAAFAEEVAQLRSTIAVEDDTVMGDLQQTTTTTPTIFISYAREEGRKLTLYSLLDRLLQHLKPLESRNEAIVWCDREMKLGTDWNPEIRTALQSAKVVIALLSPAFFASRYIRFVEMPRILQQVDEGQIALLPILLSPCDRGVTFRYGNTQTGEKARSLIEFQALNPANPLLSLPAHEQDAILLQAAQQVRQILRRLQATAPNNLPRAAATFVGRDADLNVLHQQLAQAGRIAISAISGMAGIGKTELALQYAQRQLHEGSYPGGVCWVRAREDVGVQVVSFARSYLNLTLPEGLELVEIVRWCWQHWQPDGRVLIVIDDVSDWAEVQSFLPTDDRFRVLVTTRRQDLLSTNATMVLDVLQPEEARSLLARLEEHGRVEQDQETADRLCAALGYLPLAIEWIGYYLRHDRYRTLAQVIESLQEKGMQALALARSNEPSLLAERGVKAAFDLTWEILEPETRQVARLLSYFALDWIEWDLVERVMQRVEGEAYELGELKAQLENALLVQSEPDRLGWCRLHPLIRQYLKQKEQIIVRETGEAPLRAAFVEEMIAIASQMPSDPTLEMINSFEGVRLHIQEVAEHHTEGLEGTDLTWLFVALARFYEGQELYRQAEEWYVNCLRLTESRFANDHLAVAISLNNLAYLYQMQGRLSEAEPLLVRALEMYQRLFENNHPDVANNLNNLAYLYQMQGRLSEAEPLYLQALELRRSLLGEAHPDVANSLSNLAYLYQEQGRYEQAESLLIQALELTRSRLGDQHPNMANSLSNLAELYKAQGRYEEAEPLCLQALELRRSLLGEAHPDVATSLNSLAELYRLQGRYEEAEFLTEGENSGELQPELAKDFCRSLSGKYRRGELKEIEQAVSDAIMFHLDRLNIYPEPGSSYSYDADSVEFSLLQVQFKVIEPPDQIFSLSDFDEDSVVVESELSAEVGLECTFSFTTYDSIDREDIPLGANNVTTQADLGINVSISISLFDGLTNPDSDFEVVEIEVVEVTGLDEVDWGFVEPDWGGPDDHDDPVWSRTEDEDSDESTTENDNNSNQGEEFDVDDSPF